MTLLEAVNEYLIDCYEDDLFSNYISDCFGVDVLCEQYETIVDAPNNTVTLKFETFDERLSISKEHERWIHEVIKQSCPTKRYHYEDNWGQGIECARDNGYFIVDFILVFRVTLNDPLISFSGVFGDYADKKLYDGMREDLYTYQPKGYQLTKDNINNFFNDFMNKMKLTVGDF